jgi:hypothetical protein
MANPTEEIRVAQYIPTARPDCPFRRGRGTELLRKSTDRKCSRRRLSLAAQQTVAEVYW